MNSVNTYLPELDKNGENGALNPPRKFEIDINKSDTIESVITTTVIDSSILELASMPEMFPVEQWYEPIVSEFYTNEITSIDIIPVFSSDSQKSENEINAARVQSYNELTGQLLTLIEECDLEYGFSTELDSFLINCLLNNALATKDWLNTLFIDHFHDIGVVTGVLRTIAHLEYDEIAPTGPTMALAALNHANAEVKECGIRAFENWGTRESLNYLKEIDVDEAWLKDYLMQVTSELEEELMHATLGKEN